MIFFFSSSAQDLSLVKEVTDMVGISSWVAVKCNGDKVNEKWDIYMQVAEEKY